jgi:hypothetical protein
MSGLPVKRQTQLGRFLVAGLCLLVAIFMCIQVAHGHQPGADGDNASHCQICLLTHALAMPVVVAALFVAQGMLALFLCGVPQRGSPAVAHVYFIRPPPVSL